MLDWKQSIEREVSPLLGHKTFAPKLFYEFSLEEEVPEDHLLHL